jgi:hypothetical protein
MVAAADPGPEAVTSPVSAVIPPLPDVSCAKASEVEPSVIVALVVQVHWVSALAVPSETKTVALTISAPVSASVARAGAPEAATT